MIMGDKDKNNSTNKDSEELKKFPLLRPPEEELLYHGIKPPRRIDLGKLKILSVVFVVAGLFIMYFLALQAPAIRASIQDVYGNYLYNYAVVVVEGRVIDIPSVRISQGRFSVYFTIDDGTGSLSLRIYDPLAREALAKGLVPGVGDYVKAEVQIRVIESYTYGIVQSLDTMKINHVYNAKPLRVDSLSNEMVNRYVEITGSITGVRKTSRGLYLVYVNTNSSTITVVIPNYLEYVNATMNPQTKSLKPNPLYDQVISRLIIGARIRVRGVVHLYRMTPEIVVSRLSDIIIYSEKPVSLSLDQIVFDNDKYVGKTVILNNVWFGPITYDSNSGNYVVEIYDHTYHTKAIFLSRDFKYDIDPVTTGTGSILSIVGVVCNDSSIAVVNFNVTKPVPPPLIAPSQLNDSLMGYMVVLEGKVKLEETTAKKVSYGCPLCDYYHGVSTVTTFYKFELVDPNNTDYSITVFIPGSVYNSLSYEQKKLIGTNNETVRIAGYLSEYMGTPELVVFSAKGVLGPNESVPGAGLRFEKPPAYNPVHYVVSIDKLGNVSGRVVLNTVLDSIRYLAGQFILKVHDDTGSTYIYASPNALENIDPFKMGIGSKLVVIGEITGHRVRRVVADEILLLNSTMPINLSISSISKSYSDRIVIVHGFVKSIGKGNSLVISDGVHSVNVILLGTSTMYAGILDRLGTGSKIVVAGVLVYNGNTPMIYVFTPNGIRMG
jgi:DNA/RNA endonuclease YhcR with UshA esterase domain